MGGYLVNRNKGVWLVRVNLGPGLDGKRRYHNKTIHGNEREARKYLREALAEQKAALMEGRECRLRAPQPQKSEKGEK